MPHRSRTWQGRLCAQSVELLQSASHIVGRHIWRGHERRLDEEIDKIFWETKAAT